METLQRPPVREPAPTPRGLPNPNGGRSNLPSGRAVVGGFLIALAVLGTFVAYRGVTTGVTQHYVVANTDLQPGTELTSANLTVVEGKLPGPVARQTFPDLTRLEHRRIRVAVGPGHIIQADDLVDDDKKTGFEVSIPVDASRALAGQVAVGETVLVLITGDDAETPDVIVTDVLVTKVSTSESVLGSGDGLVVSLLIGSQSDVQKVAGAKTASITIFRPPTDSEGRPKTPDTPSTVPPPQPGLGPTTVPGDDSTDPGGSQPPPQGPSTTAKAAPGRKGVRS